MGQETFKESKILRYFILFKKILKAKKIKKTKGKSEKERGIP